MSSAVLRPEAAATGAGSGLRPGGLLLVLGLHLALLALLLFRPAASQPRPARPASLSIRVHLLPLGAPPQPVVKAAAAAAARRPPAQPPIKPQARTSAAPPQDTAAPAAPTPPAQPPSLSPVAEDSPSRRATAAPSPALPAAAQLQAPSSAPSWQAELMARLAQHRRYPEGARARREQGVSHVRLRLNRGGQLLALRLERSSGHIELDRAALATVRAAVPLPAIPPELPEEMELLLPVEFELFSAG